MRRNGKINSGAETPQFPPVRIVTGAAFELIAELAAFTSGPARASLDSGKTWIRDVRRLAGRDLIARVERFGIAVYGELSTIALVSAPPHGAADFLTSMRAMPAEALRRRLLGADSEMNRSMVGEGAFDRAIAGDVEAIAELRATFGGDRSVRAMIDRLLASPAEKLKTEMIDVVDEWSRTVFPAFAADALAAIERDVKAKQREFGKSGETLLAAATGGIAVQPSPWISEIVIAPSVALRPFIAPTEVGSTTLLLTSVGDEAFDVDPAAPPRRLVKVAAALGDELRLRILHALSEESLSASEIADRLGVDRTSLHHHLGILRSAGLLTIVDEGVRGWRYGLRENAAEVMPALGPYLAGGRATPARDATAGPGATPENRRRR
jgi:DNA-binding transcriptional ArsR family regulator